MQSNSHGFWAKSEQNINVQLFSQCNKNQTVRLTKEMTKQSQKSAEITSGKPQNSEFSIKIEIIVQSSKLLK